MQAEEGAREDVPEGMWGLVSASSLSFTRYLALRHVALILHAPELERAPRNSTF